MASVHTVKILPHSLHFILVLVDLGLHRSDRKFAAVSIWQKYPAFFLKEKVWKI